MGLVPIRLGPDGVPDRFKCSGEVNSPCAKVFAPGKNACLGKAQIGSYSRIIPDASQAAMVLSSHMDTWTSPIWALPRSSMDKRD